MIMNLMYFFSTNKLKNKFRRYLYVCMDIFLLHYKCTVKVNKYQGSLRCLSMIILPVYNINVGQILKE